MKISQDVVGQYGHSRLVVLSVIITSVVMLEGHLINFVNLQLCIPIESSVAMYIYI